MNEERGDDLDARSTTRICSTAWTSASRACCCSPGCTCSASAPRARSRSARPQRPALRDLALLAAGVQVSLVAFVVAAMFHPIAYQFYFFSIAGLAVALRNIWRAETGAGAASPRSACVTTARILKVVPTLMCGGTENQFMTLSRRLDPRALRSRVRLPAPLGTVRPGAGGPADPAVGIPGHDVPQRAGARAAGAARAAHRPPADRDRPRLQLLRQRVRRAAGAAGGAGRHRVDPRLRALPDADAEARAALRLPVRRLRARQRRRRQGLADRRRLRRVEDRRHPERRRPDAVRRRRPTRTASAASSGWRRRPRSSPSSRG